MRELLRVTKAHKATYNYFLTAKPGDVVTVGREDPEMPGWRWCRNKEGVEMWVPDPYVERRGDIATFLQPYCSVELDASEGDVVQKLGECLEWTECLDSNWRYGWIPANKLASMRRR